MDMTTLREAVVTLDLATQDEVAELLRLHGVKGERSRVERCPLAVYLAAEVGVPIGTGAAFIFPRAEQNIDRWSFTPGAVIGFMERFDDGHWPSLEAEASS